MIELENCNEVSKFFLLSIDWCTFKENIVTNKVYKEKEKQENNRLFCTSNLGHISLRSVQHWAFQQSCV